MKPPHSESPESLRRFSQQENLRQRQQRNAEEIVRFVRELQTERQPSSLRLQKKAPLPGIGQHNCMKTGTSDSGFLDRAMDSTDSDDDSLDNEIVHAQRRNNTRKVDPFFIEMLTCPRGSVNTSNDYNVLSRSLSQVPQDVSNNNVLKISRQNSFIRHGKKHSKITGYPVNNKSSTGKQLPPLSRDNNIPDRPSAPSPSRTPPMSEYSFIEEEPLDYLDLS